MKIRPIIIGIITFSVLLIFFLSNFIYTKMTIDKPLIQLLDNHGYISEFEVEEKDDFTLIKKVIMGEKVDKVPSKEELRRIAIHEVGHGFISEFYFPNSVASITVVPRGQALGYMRQINNETFLETKTTISNRIAVMVAGAMAEKVFYENYSTGASNDFNQAITLAQKVIDSGLSDLGVTNCKILPKGLLSKEISNIIEGIKKDTEEILVNNKTLIENLAEFLLANETISGEGFRSKINC